MVVSLALSTPEALAKEAAAAAKALRLEKNFTREDLAARAGVPAPTLRRFEETGLAPFLTVLKIAAALGRADQLVRMFAPSQDLPATLDELIRSETRPARRRARKSGTPE